MPKCCYFCSNFREILSTVDYDPTVMLSQFSSNPSGTRDYDVVNSTSAHNQLEAVAVHIELLQCKIESVIQFSLQ